MLVVAAVLAAAPAFGHDFERTQAWLAVEADGSFVLDVANDPTWLLMRLAPFGGGGTAVGPFEPGPRDARLRQLAAVFADRLVLWVDSREVRATSVEYLPPRPQTPADEFPPLATYRLRGRMSAGSRELRWFYGIVIDPYPLTVRRPDGQSEAFWILGPAWSESITLTGGPVPTRWRWVMRDVARGFTRVLPGSPTYVLLVACLLLTPTGRAATRDILALIAARTLGLALAAYGFAALPPAVLNPLLALSVVCLSAENLLAPPRHWRLGTILVFGWLHGLGLAEAVRGLGVPRTAFLTTLALFNLGVDLAQLILVAAVSACALTWRPASWYRDRVVVPASLSLAAVGFYWALVRL